MARSWCKVSAALDSHPRIRRAGNLGRQVFEFALRRNAELDRNGVIPAEHLDPSYLADVLMFSEQDAVTGLSGCVRTGLLASDGDQYVICGWDDAWGKYPMTEAERKRISRARYRNNTTSEKCPDTIVTESDGPECHRSDQIRSEEIRGEEIRLGAPPAAPTPKPARARKPPAARMPENWAPRPQERAKAENLGLVADQELERFKDHHSAKGSVFVDWDAAFRTWLGNAQRFAAGSQTTLVGPVARGRPQTLFEAAMESVAQAEARERAGGVNT